MIHDQGMLRHSEADQWIAQWINSLAVQARPLPIENRPIYQAVYLHQKAACPKHAIPALRSRTLSAVGYVPAPSSSSVIQ